jgi:hypothetical protein
MNDYSLTQWAEKKGLHRYRVTVYRDGERHTNTLMAKSASQAASSVLHMYEKDELVGMAKEVGSAKELIKELAGLIEEGRWWAINSVEAIK